HRPPRGPRGVHTLERGGGAARVRDDRPQAPRRGAALWPGRFPGGGRHPAAATHRAGLPGAGARSRGHAAHVCGARLAHGGRFSDAESRASGARVHPEGGARDGRRAPAASTPRAHQGRRRPGRRAGQELSRAARALLPAGARAARRLPGRDAVRRSAGGRVPRAGAQELRLHPFHRGSRSRGGRELLRHLRRAAHLRALRARRARHSPHLLRAHVLLPALRRHGVAQDLSARRPVPCDALRYQSAGAAAERYAAAARVQPAGSRPGAGRRTARGGGRMTDKPLSAVEKVKEESRGLRGDLAAQLSAGGDHFSDAGAQLLKFHGTYQQEDRDPRRERRGTDTEPAHPFMVRCKIPGGALTGEQYLVIDELADRYGNGTLRVTTRQGNQFHGVLKGDLKATIRSVNDVLVTTLGACGDVVRNVIACPAPLAGGLREEVLRLARQVSDHLLPRTRAYHEIWLDGEPVAGGPPGGEPDPIYGTRYLPRKFKLAFAFPHDNCCDVHSNDLGFLVVTHGERLAGFNVLVGGGMGRTHGKTDTYPRLADTLGFARTGEVREVAEAVVKVQRDHGNRSDRRHARLKYLLDREGLDWFRDQVERQLGRPLPPAAPVEVSDIEDHLGWHEQGK